MDSITPVFITLGLGGVLGYCAGMFIKLAMKLAGCLLGLVFLLMQVMAYYGFAEWHWDVITQHATPAVQQTGQWLHKLLYYNLPLAGSFGAGLWIALRR